MATGKKSFILYCDLIHTVKKLPDAKAGKLLKTILEYVNDEDPKPKDVLVDLVFEQIKQQLKRDLKEWEDTKTNKSEGGKLGNLKRWNEDLYIQVIEKKMSLEQALVIANDRKTSHSDSKESVPIASVAVNGTVNVTDTVIVKENTIESRKLKFASTLEPFLELYGRDMLNDFYRHWSESNQSNTKFKKELEKTWEIKGRLETWAKREKNFTKNNQQNGKSTIGKTVNTAEQWVIDKHGPGALDKVGQG